MKHVYSDIIEFRGSHYEFGKRQGELLRESVMLENREKEWRLRKPRFAIDVTETKQVFQKFAPQIWEELLGLRDGLDWPLERVLKNFSGYRLDYVRSGCSIVTGKDFFVRNYDYHPRTYDGRFVLFQPSDGGYATIAPSSRVTGRMDGMNEKGLVMGYNFMHRKKPGNGFVCTMIGRLILENCQTAKEAVQFLKEIPHRHSFSYTLSDQNGDSFTVETTPRQVIERRATLCTNHFELLTEENRYHLDDSKRRLSILQEATKDDLTAMGVFRLMNDSGRGIFSKDYHNWSGTIHTTVYFPKQLGMGFALGEVDKPVMFDFKKWLNGESLNLDRIDGYLETDIPFAQMEAH
ncbi:MAG TPA: C45 family peptidase [Cerasibacillus sp.]|uniref:C45 family peptidase n=1 Tax=Cerasibacillus sp. TaxID=2498711 RepID=UPI002F418119